MQKKKAFLQVLTVQEHAGDLEKLIAGAGPRPSAGAMTHGRIKGSLVRATPRAIEGWAVDDASEGMPVHVRLYYRNEVVTEVLADQDATEDGRKCGFNIQLPKYFADGKARRIVLRAGSSDTILNGTPCLIGEQAQAAN